MNPLLLFQAISAGIPIARELGLLPKEERAAAKEKAVKHAKEKIQEHGREHGSKRKNSRS